jgi:hypothetical protein
MGLELETIGLMLGAIITVFLFLGFILGDNPLYRWTLALLVGVGTGYAFAITLNFLLDWMVAGATGETPPFVVLPPLVLGVLLLLKGFPRAAPWGNWSLAFVFGAGAAVAISGALFGTLLPQMLDTAAAVTLEEGPTTLVEGLLMLGGVSLALFAFSPRSTEETASPSVRVLRRVGRGIGMIALAMVFVGMLSSALTLLVERWWALVNLVFFQLPNLFGA